MTAPRIQGTPATTELSTAFDEDSVYNLPSGIVAGELLCIWVATVLDSWTDSPASGGHTWNTPAGWTMEEGQAGPGGSAPETFSYANSRLWTRLADGSEGSTATFTAHLVNEDPILEVAIAVRIRPSGSPDYLADPPDILSPWPSRQTSFPWVAGPTGPNPLITLPLFPESVHILGLAGFHVSDKSPLSPLSPPTNHTQVAQIVHSTPSAENGASARMAVFQEIIEGVGNDAYDPVASSGMGSNDYATATSLAVAAAVETEDGYWGILETLGY